ncbi:dynein regulatory complex subunit 2-like isoform 2-T2 [Menidia menidia]
MSKKGKKGGAKTEEERVLQRQQRAQAEEEMARRKEETLTLYLKDKLQKEQGSAAVNLLKVSAGWRTLLRQDRDGQLRRELSVLQQTVERHLDQQDHLIQRLVRELQEAELQASQVQRGHLQQLEALRGQQGALTQALEGLWGGGLQELRAACSSQRAQVLARFRQQQVQVQDQVLTGDQQHRDALEAVEEAFYKTRLFAQNLRQTMEMTRARRDPKDLKAAQQDLKTLKANSQTLKDLNQEVQRVLQRLDSTQKAMRRQKEEACRLRARLASRAQERGGQTRAAAVARRGVSRRCQQLRRRLDGDRRDARRQLGALATLSQGAASRLQAAIGKGEKLLRLADLCRRLEEKHLPALPAEEPGQRRLNGAVFRREAVRLQRDELQRQNLQLEALLSRPAAGGPPPAALLTATRAPTAIRAPTTATRAPTTATRAPTTANHRHTVIEAAHAVKHAL